MKTLKKIMRWTMAMFAAVLVSTTLTQPVAAQDQQDQDDPPSRVARLGYMQGSISFQPAGESEWVEAVQNRPMTTGDKIWADRDSRAELQLGSAVIDLNSNSGISFLNLDDRTVQIQLSSGSINVRVRHLSRDDVFEIDTPNQAFSIYQPGRYRVEASEDGTYTVVSIREGQGESTGNGQTYTVHAGQRVTFSGTNSLNAEVEQIGAPDDFDNWCYRRYGRYENAQSARYVSHDVVGYEDLDDNGDWRPSPSYGNVWFPHVSAGWAPYREGHWAWIDPWGWTWVDDEPWGYAPFHYGRWVFITGRWGWLPGPVEVVPVYAPALVVFVGGGGGFGGIVGWFPLGPREVFVPSYRVSRGYVNRVNISNTTVNTTTITNVYNTTIVNNKTTNITNVTYMNRNVSGAVTAVPQRTFANAQPVARAAVTVNQKELASAPISARAAFAPTSNSVLGVHANTANRVAAPPTRVANRAVVAKATAPPPPAPFAARQQQLAEHPGQPIPRQEMQRLRPAPAQPLVKQAPPGKPATPTMARPGNQPGNPASNQPANRPGNRPEPNQPQPSNRPETNRPETNRPQPNQPSPENRRAEPPARNDRPTSAQPGNRPEPNQPQPSNRPEPNRPETNRPQPNQPSPENRRAEPPARNDRPPSAQPGNRPEPNQPPPSNRPETNRPETNRPETNRPETNRPQPKQPSPENRRAEPPARNDRPPSAQPGNRPESNQPPPSNRREQDRSTAPPQRNEPAARPPNPPSGERPPQRNEPAETRPAPPQKGQQSPEEKKRDEEKRKQDEKRKQEEKSQPPGGASLR
jgi:hypothetical protein